MFKYLLPIKPPYSELDSVVKLLFHPLCPVYFDSMVWSLFTAKKKKATKQKKQTQNLCQTLIMVIKQFSLTLVELKGSRI